MAKFSPRVIQAFAAAKLPAGLQVRDAAGDTPAEILIYDQIGDSWDGEGVSAKAFASALAGVGGGPVNIRINSPGGDVFDGMAIYNALRMHPGEVVVYVDGVAASAASFIACAGSRVVMGEQAMLMIHNASTVAWGDKREMTATAGVLGKIDGQIADIYATKSGKPAAGFADLMNAETYMTPTEAVASGLANEIAAPPAAAADPPRNSAADDAERERRIRLMRARLLF